MNDQILAWAERIWNYHLLNHQLTKADAILVLCSHDKVVAERGAQLFLDGWAPLLIFSGGLGAITKSLWSVAEADQFAEVAISMGVPSEKVLIENRSTNTAENILFTKAALAKQQINPRKFILVQKPYMERRSYASFRKLWPEKEVVVTSPQLSFKPYMDNCANGEIPKERVVSIIVGDLQRIKLYGERGYQIYQQIPDDVWAAYEALVRAGYDKHLIVT